MKSTSFIKAQALGNDFVIINAPALTAEQVCKIADRRYGIGCDQVILYTPTPAPIPTAHVRFFNADGSEAESCGNGLRALALLLSQNGSHPQVHITSLAGNYDCSIKDDQISVKMNRPIIEKMNDGIYVNVGNPHFVNFIDPRSRINVLDAGPKLEHHPAFPDRVNVSFASPIDKKTLRLTVWERGAGFTQACGTGACASAAAAIQVGHCLSPVTVIQQGGNLTISWDGADDFHMTGTAEIIFSGTIL